MSIRGLPGLLAASKTPICVVTKTICVVAQKPVVCFVGFQGLGTKAQLSQLGLLPVACCSQSGDVR